MKVPRKKQKTNVSKLDRGFLILILLLVVVGLVAVADASAPQALRFFKDELYFFKQQVVWATLGVGAMFVSSFINYKYWEKLAKPLFLLNILLLVAVLIPGIGLSVLGAKRWIVLGSISFQPSELAKLTMSMYLAKVASKDKGPLSYFLPVGMVAGLIMLEPDLGTTMIVSGMAFIQVFISGISLLYFVLAGMVAFVLTIALILTSDYRRSRLETFLELTRDPLDSAYHIRQVLLALGSGGLFGVGIGHSRQKYLFLPEAATDSILAVIAEETGFVGAFVLIMIFGALIYKGIKIAEKAPDTFSKVLATGIISWIGLQTIVNVGAMIAIFPLTGIPLPFISYGGTALITVLFATGILLNISKYGSTKS